MNHQPDCEFFQYETLQISLPITGLFTATVFIVKKLKEAEHEDYFDTNTNFNPFTIKQGT